MLPALAARLVFVGSRPDVDLWIVIDEGVYAVADPAAVLVMGGAAAAFLLAGLFAWAVRAQRAALLLGLALAVQLAYIAIYP